MPDRATRVPLDASAPSRCHRQTDAREADFGPDRGEPLDAPGAPSVAVLDVYVSEAGAIEVVTGRFLVDGAASGFVHRIDTIADPEPIELPDPAFVTDVRG